MKLGDIMIGNWIVDNGKYAQITGITCDGIIETTVNKNSNIELIEPIPLDGGILDKNFHHISGYWVWECGDVEIQWVPETMDRVNPLMQYRLAARQQNPGVADTLICHIEYIHQLQNALALCGIKKEIEL